MGRAYNCALSSAIGLRFPRSIYNGRMDIVEQTDAAHAHLKSQQGGAGVLSGTAGDIRHLMNAPVYYEDTDFSGFVYHANYLKFAERGRSNLLRLCGIEHTDLLDLEPQLAFVVGHMDIDFLAPARIGDMLLVETVFTKMRGARLLAEQVIKRDATPLWQARVEAAIVDLDGRPRRLPKALAEKMQAHLGAPLLGPVSPKTAP